MFTIATARPAGLRRLGLTSGYWKTARLVELQRRQQCDLATKLLSEDDSAVTPVALRVQQFFQQLEHSGRLQSLAGNPLLLHGMLSVAARQIILPNTRFQLLQKLIEILLEVHPNRRATAAAEVKSRTPIFSTDDVRSDALAKLAFHVHVRGADAGLDRDEARRVIEEFLADSENGPAWTKEKARVGARELTDVDADTSGLLVERGPEELAFCHAAFREHLAGLELTTWPLENQVGFVSGHAGEPRWRGAILALLQSLKRRADVERILEAIRDESEGDTDSIDRRLLLAEGAFATASLSGPIGRRAAVESLRRIDSGTDEAEGLELLSLALDGPRAGPIGEAIRARLARWWPGVTEWQAGLYAQLGSWEPTDELAQTLQLVLRGDSNQLAASSSLARVFGGNPEVGGRLISLTHESVNPWVTAAVLDALSRGWPSVEGLDQWLHEAESSPSIQLRTVAALALYRRGRRDDERRDSLLDALGMPWSRFTDGLHPEIIDALVADWAQDGDLQDACWATVGRQGPPTHNISYDIAFGRMPLDRIGPEDVAAWFDAASRDKPGAANRAFEILRAMMFRAEEWGLRERNTNPCLGIAKNPRNNVARFLDADELARLGRALDAHEARWPEAVAAIRLLALTGCRRSEVLDLRWRDIGEDAINLADSKTGPRAVPLGEAARALIAALPGPREPDAFLFPRHAQGRGIWILTNCWRTACADARLGRLRLHDLRHTAASQAVMAGENLPLVGKLLGHRRHRTTAGYAHLADAHLVEAAEKVGRIIARAMADGRRSPCLS